MGQSEINQWVGTKIYELLENAKQTGSVDTATLTPLIQMYHAMQIKEASSDITTQLERINDNLEKISDHLDRLQDLSGQQGDVGIAIAKTW